MQLVVALEQLGLNDEAAKFENSVVATPGGAAAVRYGSPTVQTDRVSELLGQGKREQAIKLVIGDISTQARAALTQPGGLSNNSYGFERLRRLVRAHGLVEEVLAKLDPGESANELKLSQYGIASELVGEDEKAIAAYQAALKKNSRNDAVRIRLALLLAGSDVAAAAQEFAKINPRKAAQAGQEIVAFLSDDDEGELMEGLHVVDAVERYLRGLKETDKIDLSWALELVDVLANRRYARGQSLPSLYAKIDTESPDYEAPKGVMAQFAQQRRKVHDQLCRTLLSIPQTAPEAFTHLLATAEVDGNVGDEYAKQALDALLLHALPSASAQNQYGGYGGRTIVYGDSGEQSVVLRTPAEFLVRHAWKAGKIKWIEDEVAPALEKAKKSEAAKEIRAELALFTCTADEFAAVAEKFCRPQQRSSRYPQFVESGERLSKIVAIWEERGLKTDLAPLLTEAVKKNLAGGQYWETPAYAVRYAALLARDGRRDRVGAFFEDFAEIYLGPKGERKAQIEKHFDPSGVRSNSVNAQIHGYVQLMEQMSGKRELFFVALDQLAGYGLGEGANSATWRLQEVMFGSDGDTAEGIIQGLDHSPFVADLDGLRVYPTSNGSGKTLMSGMLKRIRHIDNDSRTKIRAQLLAEQPPKFGAGLIAAYLDESPAAAVLGYAAKHQQALQALPQQKKKEVALLIVDLAADGSGHLANVSDELQPFVNWLKSVNAGERDELLKNILAAKRLSELGTNRSHDSLAALFPPLIESDPDQAKRVFYKLLELFEKEQDNRYAGTYSGDEVENQLASQVLQQSQNLPSMAFAIDLMLPAEEDRKPIVFNRYMGRYWQTVVQSAYVAAGKDLPDSEKQRGSAAVKRLYEQLAENFGQRPTTVFAGAYRAAMGNLPSEELKSVIAWADEEAQADAHPQLARELAAAARMALASKQPRPPLATGQFKPLPLADYHRYYLQVLKDHDLPPSWRLTVVGLLAEAEHSRLPNEIVLGSIGVWREAIDAKQTVNVETNALLSVFLAQERDEPWRAAAAALADSWQRRYVSATNRQTRGSSGEGLSDLVAMLKLNLLLDDEQKVAQLLQRQGDRLAGNRNGFALLVAHNRNAMAAKLLRANPDQLAHDRPRNAALIGYDRKLHAAMPEFLESLPSDVLRYEAEILLATLPDAVVESEQFESDRAARVKDLAQRFGQIEFATPVAKERALALLSADDEASGLLAAPLAEVAGTMKLRDVMLLENSYLQQRRRSLVLAYLKERMVAGEFKPMVATLADLSRADSVETYALESMKRTIANTLVEVIKNHQSTWPQERLLELLPVTRTLATPNDVDYRYYQAGPLNSTMIAVHAAAGKMDDLDTWWKSLSDDHRKSFREGGVREDVWSTAAEFAGKADQSNLPRRLDLAKRILHSGGQQGWIEFANDQITQRGSHRGTLLTSMTSSNLLNREELLQHGAELAAAAPAGGMVWAMLANAQAGANKHDEAATSWKKAIETAPQDDALRQTRWRMKLATTLRRLKRPEEASGVLEGFDRKLIHEESRTEFDALLKSLKAAEPADKSSWNRRMWQGSRVPAIVIVVSSVFSCSA